jgi:hypothetical protein
VIQFSNDNNLDQSDIYVEYSHQYNDDIFIEGERVHSKLKAANNQNTIVDESDQLLFECVSW